MAEYYLLTKINELFKIDFECFGYKKIEDITTIKSESNHLELDSNNINVIKKNCFIIKLLEEHKKNTKLLLNNSHSEFCNIIEGFYNSNLSGNLAYSSKKSEIQTALNDIDYFNSINNYNNVHDSVTEILNEKTYESNKKENHIKICNKCNNFTCYNVLAYNAHVFFCKVI